MTTKRKKKNSIKPQFSPAILVLENKSIFRGIGLGYQGNATGEICFNTSLTGYQEIISDPSYAGQIINFTFPHIGNVGANNEDLESDIIWTRGVIFNSEITSPSNYRSLKNLDEWLKKNKIVGITGLDTRSLTNFIRDKGAPKGTISNNNNGYFNSLKLSPTKSNSNVDIAFILNYNYLYIEKNKLPKRLNTFLNKLGITISSEDQIHEDLKKIDQHREFVINNN